jgi:hypothetical protein
MAMEHLSDDVSIPCPSKEILADLTPIDFEGDEEFNWSATVDEKVDRAISMIDTVDSSVLDVVGHQMTVIAETFEETIKATQTLFAALVRLKSTQTAMVQQKKETTTKLLRKLQQTMTFLRTV